MPRTKVLVVDDDDTFRTLIAGELARRGYEAAAAADARGAQASLRRDEPDLVLLDLRLGDDDGIEVLRHIRSEHPRVETLMLTGHGDIGTAIASVRLGAFDYLRKPCPIDELEVALQKAREHQSLLERNAILRGGFAPPDLGDEFVGCSREFRDLLAVLARVATVDSAVLITGETGVGKDVAAKLIHARSARRGQPLVVVECAALHDDLLHSELFGHEQGAYTGATRAKHGLFEVADGGTIFLDEIGDVSPATQVALLRVLEAGRFRHVGGTREIAVDVRVIAATNCDLEGMIARGYFRRDLFYRLSTIRVDVPPLRARRDDIPCLLEHFLRRLNQRFGQNRRFGPDAWQRLCSYHWPGNVRELLHAVERTVILAGTDVISEDQLPAEIRAKSNAEDGPLLTLEELERLHIRRVLGAVSGNRSAAASILGISERTLYRRIKDLGLPEGEGG